MGISVTSITVQRDAAIPTWFGIGGRAETFAVPSSADELRACLEIDPTLRVLGDGANLLVHDAGVSELVVSLAQGEFAAVRPLPGSDGAPDRETVVIRAGAGANLPKAIVEAVRLGLAGLEGLGGIPASIGGALVMNAGGAFGQIADSVQRVHALDRGGRHVSLERDQIAFSYRHSGLQDLIITSCDLVLRRADPGPLRERLKQVMAYKKASQPMADRSAGCCYKNPTLGAAIPEVGGAGERVSAGLLIDRSGCKGLRVGGAVVSDRHANFITVADGAQASHVIELMEAIERRVLDRFGLRLEREVVVWTRDGL
ncbi:MAG: UDP-N-acetylmuramate dehydrogenase [Phycisphaerales bacterium]|nr:UDP-N-acetylmuramate dehydrogenase [Phycisphaerales bacterium]